MKSQAIIVFLFKFLLLPATLLLMLGMNMIPEAEKKLVVFQFDRMNVLAYDVLHGLVGNPVGNSTHYHTTKVNPYWVNDVNYIANVGNHIFYRGDK